MPTMWFKYAKIYLGVQSYKTYLHFVEMMSGCSNGSICSSVGLMSLQRDLLRSVRLSMLMLMMHMRITSSRFLRCTPAIAFHVPHGPLFPPKHLIPWRPAIAPASHRIGGQRCTGCKNGGRWWETAERALVLQFLPKAALLSRQIDDLSQDKSVLGQRSKHQ